MAKKSKPHQTTKKTTGTKSTSTYNKSNDYKKKPIEKKKPRKERGFWLTFALVVMAVHGVFAAFLYYSPTLSPAPTIQRPWILGLMVVHSLANIVAAVGIWYWKKWALYVYAASTVIALVVGLMSVGIWSVFYMVLPLAIVGWLLRTKWDYFE
jgi:predicted MFS family arabinose efflux permease